MRSLRKSIGALLTGCLLVAPLACATGGSGLRKAASAPRVLIVGGGGSHDFGRWFHKADSTTLASTGAQVSYTDVPGSILPELERIDVLFLSNNQPLPDPALRQGIFDFVAAGKGLMIVHASSWYNWRDWPAYNRELVGGGARSHRRYGEFEVKVVAPDHPIMQGVPASFKITDELYRSIPDTTVARINVLATAQEVETGTVYPIIWTVEGKKGRIVVNTLGHDGEAHNHPAYQQILRNSLRWVSGQVQ